MVNRKNDKLFTVFIDHKRYNLLFFWYCIIDFINLCLQSHYAINDFKNCSKEKMKKEIFPKEIIESTIEAHRFKHTNKSKVIYSFILFALIVALVSLPYINITIYNTSQGLIRSDKERIILQSSHI